MIKKRAMSNSRQYPNLEIDKKPNYMVVATSVVDGENWYSIRCPTPTARWVRETYGHYENTLWHETIDDTWHIYRGNFDVSEKMLTLISLRW